ncbi:MAG: hypothetical protein HC930_14615 [Hydrococcus sp. SU_1_0]|nr:hypothetical protein [Hydrococcus sp. SU_1_0]
MIGKLKTGEIQQKLTNQLIDLETSTFGLRKKIANLKRTEQEQIARMQQSPIVEQKLRVLTRELDSLDSTYKVLQQQLQNINNAESQDSSNIRVIANADLPSEPLFPRTVGYLASVSLALLAASIVIYLSEAYGRSAKTVNEVRQIENYGAGALETIPEVHEIRYLTEEDIRRLTAEIVRLYSK